MYIRVLVVHELLDYEQESAGIPSNRIILGKATQNICKDILSQLFIIVQVPIFYIMSPLSCIILRGRANKVNALEL